MIQADAWLLISPTSEFPTLSQADEMGVFKGSRGQTAGYTKDPQMFIHGTGIFP
jgi:hypothetical protein